MLKRLPKSILTVAFFAATLLSFGYTPDASATKLHLKTTPLSFDYELNPGDVKEGKFTVTNKGDETINYQTNAVPYYMTDDENGGLKVSYDVRSTHTQIADWVTFLAPTGQIAPNSSVDIEFLITVPEDATSGGQYAALLVSNSNTDIEATDGISIAEIANIGPVIYAKVNGSDITTTGTISTNDISGFLFNPPITASATVHNTGNVHADAKYILKVYPLFGGESIYNNEDHPSIATVLPGSTRYHAVSWTSEDGAPGIGIYKVEFTVRMFDDVAKVEQTIIICPVWTLVAVSVFIIALIIWLVSRVKSRKAEI